MIGWNQLVCGSELRKVYWPYINSISIRIFSVDIDKNRLLSINFLSKTSLLGLRELFAENNWG
jgi:hypothetical protein